MKRYTPPYVDWMQEGEMVEREEGEYVKYEDVMELINSIIHVFCGRHISRREREIYIKDSGQLK